ncbi:MAG TPA: 6-carboxytetrahydropterin synthase [Paraburkholderia sp.]|jgi:6-pyruvoyltetrahydropterin/6-carboxytetrahydropterin synthase
MEATTSYELSQKFFFDAAHTLDREVDAEGSRRIHGHTYHAQVAVRGTPHADSAMLVDLGLLNAHIRVVRDQLDHRFLDEVPGLGPATLENLCAFIHRELSVKVPNVVRVRVERPASGDRCELVAHAGAGGA